MAKLDYKAISTNAKSWLNEVTTCLKSGYFTIKEVELYEITDNTKLQDLVTRKNPNKPMKYEKYIFEALESISRCKLENKQILYCVHVLGIKRKNLRNDSPNSDYSFGDPFRTYDKAILEYGLANTRFVEFID